LRPYSGTTSWKSSCLQGKLWTYRGREADLFGKIAIEILKDFPENMHWLTFGTRLSSGLVPLHKRKRKRLCMVTCQSLRQAFVSVESVGCRRYFHRFEAWSHSPVSYNYDKRRRLYLENFDYECHETRRRRVAVVVSTGTAATGSGRLQRKQSSTGCRVMLQSRG